MKYGPSDPFLQVRTLTFPTNFDFKPEVCQEPKKLAELQLGVRNFCGDINARNKEK